MSRIRRKTLSGLAVGDTFTVTRAFSEAEVHRFADLTRDYNPIHFDQRFCNAKGIPRIICHGLLVGGMLTEIGGQIGWLAHEICLRFRKPVFCNQAVTCTLTITAVDGTSRARAAAVWEDAGGGGPLVEGTLTGILPRAPELAVMAQMVAEGDPSNKLPP
ncbi:MAG: MaoC/PaaZ C-terminal domain-containing protein [Desulfosarcinaceae bacterium]|nr:MaoC/PaaZ C-terminal domain-containing protein [Desulfosarcinaceae bacterium]